MYARRKDGRKEGCLKHTISCPSDVKMHALKSVVSPVNLLYRVQQAKGAGTKLRQR
jgi:hypothetical protein